MSEENTNTMDGTGFPNTQQREIMEKRDGALLVLAPAGTGKTRVMAERLALAIEDGIDPDRTLGVTFTNRAAGEMRGRVAGRLGDAARHTNIRTFHGLCAWMLRQEAQDLGLARDYVIYDEEDSKEVLRFCLRGTRTKAQDAYWDISKHKSGCPVNHLSLAAVPRLDSAGLAQELAVAADKYHNLLAARNALDFADLIYHVRAMLALMPDKRDRWSRRFDWIQVDEVQDTHHSEYDVIRQLALRTKNVALFGDIDQTIYEWRGSEPDAVLELFKEDFKPVAELSLVDNYRATRTLLRLADGFAATFASRRTSIRPAPGLPEGEQPVLHSAPSPGGEAGWIAERIAALTRNAGEDKTPPVSVLTRTHRRSQAVSDAMTAARVPHITVEEFEFFRRQEIKDVLARFRLLLNPYDAGALGRVTRRPASGIGNATLKTLWQEGEPAALRITDLIRPETHTHGEPFAPLLAGLRDGTVVVLDVETTGLSPAEDEVVDVGAVRVINGAIQERFQSLIHPTCPVGFSSEVHGLSDEVLKEKGREPDSVFKELRDFAGDDHIVGHNVRFDLSMLKAHGARVGVRFDFPSWDDTLEIGRRLVSLERYDLGTLCGHFGTPHLPSHRALADAEATADVLLALRDHLAAGQGQRLELVGRLGDPFARMAGLFETWRKAAEELRPAELCRLILTESGLGEHYADDDRRTGHLEDLIRFLAANDQANAAPRAALEEVVQKVALARNVDHLDEDDPRVPIITIHQSKGLEFDVVFVAGASKGEIPSYYAVKEGRVEEERRLFYVAITRAKRRLFISCFDRNDFGYSAGPSEFLRAVGGSIAR